jgi:hypothetical protein
MTGFSQPFLPLLGLAMLVGGLFTTFVASVCWNFASYETRRTLLIAIVVLCVFGFALK